MNSSLTQFAMCMALQGYNSAICTQELRTVYKTLLLTFTLISAGIDGYSRMITVLIREQVQCSIFSSVLAELISHHHRSGQTKEQKMWM